MNEKSRMVPLMGKCFHEIREEIKRWREILSVPYQEYLLNK